MKIIIAGAGSVGFHLAELLANENQNITLIDADEGVLEHAAAHLDVETIKGDAASIKILEQAQVKHAKLFLAVTTAQSTNLLTAIMAKKMGAKTTIARISNPEYLQPQQKDNFKALGVDKLFSPDLLAAQEIERLLQRSSFTDVFEFEDSDLSFVGFTVDNHSLFINRSLKEIAQNMPNFLFRAVAILRSEKTIIPFGNTILQKGDHLYLIAQNTQIDNLAKFVGKSLHKVKKIMILGGTSVAFRTAQLLENKYAVTIIEKNKEICKSLIEKLHNTLVIHASPHDVDILKQGGLGKMDALIALTKNAETNIITCLLAEEAGVYKTIASVDNIVYTHISKNIGVDTLINKKLIAANNIFRFVRKGKIEAIASFHGVNAEIILFVVYKNNRLVRHPLKDLHLPKEAIIAGVIRHSKSFIPTGDFQLQLHDKVIVFVLPKAIAKIETLFR